MNVLFRELRANRRSLAIWALALALLNIFMMSVFPTFAQDAEKMDEFMAMFPDAFKKAFGLDKISLGDPIGYYAGEAYILIILFGSIYAAILGAGILAKEEDEKTIEFLLARPITRPRILSEKIAAWLVLLALFNLVIGLFTVAGYGIFVQESWSFTALLSLLMGPFIAQIFFASAGFLGALFFNSRRGSLSMGIGMVLTFYFLGIAAGITERFSWLKWFTPFYYMDGPDIVVRGGVSLPNAAILLGAAGLALAGAYYLYNQRDITV